MNPIDEYAALRPDHEAPTPDDLDRLWIGRAPPTARRPAEHRNPMPPTSVDVELRCWELRHHSSSGSRR